MNRWIALLLCLIMALSLLPLSAGLAETYEEITPGTKGDVVEKLQRRLAELGYYEDSLSAPYSYGNMTKAAVAAFQKENGLKDDGIATSETLSLLYSAAAKAAPPKPDVAVTSVSKSNTSLKTTFRNNTNETITYIEYALITFNNDGTIYGRHSDPKDYSKDDYYDVYYWYWYENVTLYPGSTRTLSYPLSFYHITNAPVIAVGVRAYVTQSGKRVDMDEYDIAFLTSKGKQIWPRERCISPIVLTESEFTKARTVKWGYNSLAIPYYLSSYYSLPEGDFVNEVNPNSLAEAAGLQVGDVILRINGTNSKVKNVVEKAKLEMLDGKDAVIEYSRANQIYTAVLSLDPEKMKAQNPSSEEETAPVISIADELLKYGELLEKGLITQDEYETLKKKLLD